MAPKLLSLAALLVATAADDDELSLLQLPVVHREPVDPKSQEARLKAALPVAWVHVPKCGSSFANFLIDLPGVCPEVPRHELIADPTGTHEQLKDFKKEWNVDSPNGACGPNIFRWGGHMGVGNESNWQSHYKGHAMIMLRQPEQRLMSAYWYDTLCWPEVKPPANPLEFAKKVQGCAVRMLSRGGTKEEDTCGGRIGGLPSKAEVQLAMARLRTDFAFVGLTDQWALSVCLGHRMFGGKCRLSDFVDSRVTRGDKLVDVRMVPEPWSLADLWGFTDPYDGALYQVAVEVFNDELQRFGVSVESCMPCFEEAGVAVNQM